MRHQCTHLAGHSVLPIDQRRAIVAMTTIPKLVSLCNTPLPEHTNALRSFIVLLESACIYNDRIKLSRIISHLCNKWRQ